MYIDVENVFALENNNTAVKVGEDFCKDYCIKQTKSQNKTLQINKRYKTLVLYRLVIMLYLIYSVLFKNIFGLKSMFD